jgi:hypothetical protein
MKIIPKVGFALIFALPLMVAGQPKEFTNPIEYNDYVVEAQSDVGNEIVVLNQLFVSPDVSKEKVREQLQKMILIAQNSKKKIEQLKPMNPEFGLKKAILDLIDFHIKTFSISYAEMVDELFKESPDAQKLETLIGKITADEAVLDQFFALAQEKLAKHYNFSLE